MTQKIFLLALALNLFCSAQPSAAAPLPYGANLFQGNFAKNAGTAPLMPGDRVVTRLWGAVTIDDTFTVDDQGFLHLPHIGAVPVTGIAPDKLAEDLRSKLAAAGREGTQVYVMPLDARPVNILVTGGVLKPGRYQGSSTDSVLAFLDKAGGIAPEHGSYRVVRLIRNGVVIDTVDIYPFVRNGELAPLRLREGDTLVVNPRGPTVTATGAIRNSARFEFLKGQAHGVALIDLAQPENRATHAAVSGTRNGTPYNTYVPLRDLTHLALEDGDTINFMADTTGGAMFIAVEGAVRGASRIPVRKGTRLRDVQNFIAVDPGLANLEAIYVKRKSVAARQKKAIADSLRRLEESVLTASSASQEEAQIRSQEAAMLSKFVERARSVEPEGVVVLDNGKASGDLVLEDDDVIVIPPKSDVVLVSGEVMAPQAMLWSKKKDLDDYVKGAGGYTAKADKTHALVMRADGSVSRDGDGIRSGDQILVLPKVESKSMQTVKDISQVLMQTAISARAVLGLPSLY
ncbi:MAG: polysaccharide biosynthesis/export family protein [Desulfovibrio sp.]|jgi:protein involved in polysaccharide export with SLBB domain|nr:polysaccharide biosynthesis/export family protein [Desulfovibrio sp.]